MANLNNMTPEQRNDFEAARIRMVKERAENVAKRLNEIADEIRRDAITRIDSIDDSSDLPYGRIASQVQAIVSRGYANLGIEGLPEAASDADVLRALRLRNNS